MIKINADVLSIFGVFHVERVRTQSNTERDRKEKRSDNHSIVKSSFHTNANIGERTARAHTQNPISMEDETKPKPSCQYKV